MAAVVATAGVQPGDNVIDLGCGPGQVSLALAEQGARVPGGRREPGDAEPAGQDRT
jgi:cyclopropane fatty-acyl-phospholipid synthase-like methyltransferase